MKRLPVIALAALVTSGCFDIEQTLTLERNMSGRAGFSMKIDMDPMVVFMARMAHQMSGQKGEPPAADIEKMRKEMLSDKPMDPAEFAKDRKEFEAKLPKGVTLLDATFKEQGLAMVMNLAFGFDHPSKLAQIEFPKEEKKDAAPGPPTGSPIDNPFGGLTVTDEGSTILVTAPPQNPAAETAGKDSPLANDPDTKKMMEEMFKGLRVAFKITSPLAIVENNAHRKEGNTLVWEYTMASFEKMTPEQLKQSIRVRYRK